MNAQTITQAPKKDAPLLICDQDSDDGRHFALRMLVMNRAARAGMPVYEMASGGFAVGAGANRELPDLRSLQRYLSHMGVAG